MPEPLLLLLETGPLLAGATVGAQLELLSSTAALQVRAHMAIHAREAVTFDAKVRDCQPVGLPLIAVSQLEATFLSFCACS